MITATRKLLSLAGSVGLAAGLIGCGTSGPAARAVAMPSPVIASAAAPVEAPTPQVTLIRNVAAPIAATPAAGPVATPMCDRDGRPLAGNIRGKLDRDCTAAELAAASADPAEPGS